MKRSFKFYWIIFAILGLTQCKNEPVNLTALDAFSKQQQALWNEQLTDVIVADIFTPPVASRIYAYPNIAAYEVLAASTQNYPSFAGVLHDLTPIPAPQADQEYYAPLASIIAFATVARELVYAQEKIDTAQINYLNEVKKIGIPKQLFDQSVAYGKSVGQHIIAWAGKDGYLERSAKSQYVLSKEPGRWKPTPPDYMPAIEPHWNSLRTFVIDSAQQFSPRLPTAFATDKKSTFYQETMEVYEVVNQLNEERIAIAKFWDCNPNISHTKGHLVFFDQKISPGGHWISIAGIAVKKKQLNPEEAAKVFALTSITLADAFISCWDEKYRSSLIRPETYINEHIDEKWKPLLQTPAFPEYTSGHSVISSAAAVILTHLLGNNFAFRDITEVKYGLPEREFTSFYAASEEAAISRLYGGIHYMPAIENGVEQGKAIGQFMVNNLRDFQ